jgi:hypothetical protein
MKHPQQVVAGLGAALLVVVAAGCARDNSSGATDTTVASSTAAVSPGSSATTAAAAPIPKSINDVGTYGEDLYDIVKLGDWTKGKAYLDSLRTAAASLPAGDQIQPQRAQIDSSVSTLDKAVAARNRAAALEAANRITFLSAQMTTPFHGPTPTEVLLLDYYGRELEIWAARKDLAKLKETAAALESTWNALKPTVEKSGGTVAARQTDALVARIKAAKSPSDYARVATPFLNEVDELEKVFTKQ